MTWKLKVPKNVETKKKFCNLVKLSSFFPEQRQQSGIFSYLYTRSLAQHFRVCEEFCILEKIVKYSSKNLSSQPTPKTTLDAIYLYYILIHKSSTFSISNKLIHKISWINNDLPYIQTAFSYIIISARIYETVPRSMV